MKVILVGNYVTHGEMFSQFGYTTSADIKVVLLVCFVVEFVNGKCCNVLHHGNPLYKLLFLQ